MQQVMHDSILRVAQIVLICCNNTATNHNSSLHNYNWSSPIYNSSTSHTNTHKELVKTDIPKNTVYSLNEDTFPPLLQLIITNKTH